MQDLRIEKAKLVVSTIPEAEANILLINKVRQKNRKTIIIVTARQIKEAFDLYEAGADYVILPHFLGGEHTAGIIEHAKANKKKYTKIKAMQIKNLKRD